LAYAELDIIVHRSGRPVTGNINIKVFEYRGNAIYSRGYTSNGKATLRVPENEMYRVVLDQFRYGNEMVMTSHRGKQSVQFDLDAHQTR
jgi:hypothetical protein